MRKIRKVLFYIVACNILNYVSGSFDLQKEDDLLLLSTLDGSLVCIERSTGHIRWELQEEPVVRVPRKFDNTMPLFLPDPKDGSLYMMGASGLNILQKLPFTIPQLVASSPCRSSDGILYTGKKLDTWFSINPKTGTKKSFMTTSSIDSICPREGPDAVFIGRTEFNILMMDTAKSNKMWNVTFYDYSSYEMDHEAIQRYDLVHFTGSSSGRLLTLNRDSGALQWQTQHTSPVIGMYLMRNRGLLTVPFTSIAETTLDSLIDEVKIMRTSRLGLEFKANDLKLLPTLYVGEHIHGLYALPSLVDQNTATIEMVRRAPLLLDGPSGPGPQQDLPPTQSSQGPDIVILGHYKVPDYSKTHLQIAGGTDNRSQELNGRSVAVQTEETLVDREWEYVWDALMELLNGNVTKGNVLAFGRHCWALIKIFISQQENLEIKVTMLIIIFFVGIVAWRLHRQMRDIQQMSQSSRHSSSASGGSSRSLVQITEEPSPGVLIVGKITVFTDQVLGKGCEGTFVFRGEFDSRPVAVKRVLPECFSFADREVDLLRESDAHASVVRYFCTEQDKQFRYIALELCAATVHDYVKGTFVTNKITPMEILLQATQGLDHLHSLHIVHRDIKPHNVLLSMESQTGEVRAMISDFGLCKKLPMGKASFSRRSGVTGTDGWIAPEMVHGETRATCSVDIFSMGCVFYYVMTNGKHPFGDTLHRQPNILTGECSLSALDSEDQLALKLIEKMTSLNPSDRPSTNAVLKHPFFWSQSQILAFFQDVSDRIEKENEDSFVLRRLEENSGVIRSDWRSVIDSEVAEDLRKYRNYRGDSVRDLLRALRNKKHHYRELSKQAQKNLGEIPLGFVQYWTHRFPLLLLHTWLSMQCVKREPIFKQYYDPLYTFPRLPQSEHSYQPLEAEGFSVKKPSMAWRVKPQDNLEVNWRSERRASEPKIYELSQLQEEHGSNNWFQQWYNSDFRDNNAFIQWREQEYYRRKAINQLDEELESAFNPEFPLWEYCEKLRRERRFLEDEQNHFSILNQKCASPRRFRRRPAKKSSEDPVS